MFLYSLYQDLTYVIIVITMYFHVFMLLTHYRLFIDINVFIYRESFNSEGLISDGDTHGRTFVTVQDVIVLVAAQATLKLPRRSFIQGGHGFRLVFGNLRCVAVQLAQLQTGQGSVRSDILEPSFLYTALFPERMCLS